MDWRKNPLDDREAIQHQDEYVKHSSFTRETALLIASASAISSTVTSSSNLLHAARNLPLWSLITTHAPIREEEENKAASMLMTAGGGDQYVGEEDASRLWSVGLLNRCNKINLIYTFFCSARLLGCFRLSSLRTPLCASRMCHTIIAKVTASRTFDLARKFKTWDFGVEKSLLRR
jgi:hypothetical protein